MAAIDQDSALSQLQSRAQVELLDAVDKLRRLGFQGDIGLPQLIVCGNQSSGKSSVLEAISRVRFPAKDVFCTSFATEVILRRAPRENFRVQIIPARGCDEARRAYLSSFELTTHSLSPDAIPKVIEEAGRHMQSGGQGTRFAEDILRVEISGPSQPHLTLVDLPGIIHTANRDQTDEDIDLVNRLVAEYMRQPQSIILSVVAADYDFANQVVLQRARQFDSVGRRTLGIITKPDRRDAGSAGEREYIELAQNRNISLELGWHVLRNRDFYSKNVDAESRDAEETRFFAHSSWRTLPQSSRGVDALRDKLKQILLRSIRNYLPGLLSDVSSRIEACQRNLDKLGKPRVTDAEQRQYLVTASCKLHSLIKDAVHGNYQDGFFEGLDEHPISSTRLRSTLKNAGWEFAVNMRIHGHLYGIVDESQKGPRTIAKRVDLRTAGAEGPLDSCGMPLTCSRRDYMNAIVQYMYGSQGCELPGAYSPHIVGDIFRCQSRPWQRIATNHAQYCWNLVQSFFSLAVLHVAPEHTADAMLQYVAEPLLQKALQQLQARVQELLKPYTKLHPVTYDEGYLSQVKAYESKRSEDPEGATSGERATHTPNSLEAQTILDRMQAYYKIAQRTFIDNVATLAVESCLVESLTTICSPEAFASMDVDLLRKVGAEPNYVVKDRELNQERLKTLEQIRIVCSKHVSRLGERSMVPEGSTSDDDHVFSSAPSSPASPEPQQRSQHQRQHSENAKLEVKMPLHTMNALLTPPRTPPGRSGGRLPLTRKSSSQRSPLGSDLRTDHGDQADEAEVEIRPVPTVRFSTDRRSASQDRYNLPLMQAEDEDL